MERNHVQLKRNLYTILLGKTVLPTVHGCSQCSPLLHQDRSCIGLLQQANLAKLKSFEGLNHPSLGLYLAVQETECFFRGHDIDNCNFYDVVKSLSVQGKHLFMVCKQHPNLNVTVMTSSCFEDAYCTSFLTEQQKLQAQFANKSAAAKTTIKCFKMYIITI